MLYTRAWESLAEAVKQVMEAGEDSQAEHQTDLCRAIVDGVVRVRAKLGLHANGFTTMSDTVLDGEAFSIPTDLKPEDIDWDNSRPFKPWLVLRGGRAPHGYWHLEWIEVSVADVEKAFGRPAAEDQTPAPKTPRKASKARRTRPAHEAAQRAIQATCPDGVPDQIKLPNPILYTRVKNWLSRNGFKPVSRDTILRVAGRRK